MPLAKLAEGTRGYDLLKAVLGKDPITGEPVPRTRRDADRRLHEADRAGGDLGEHEEGQRHRRARGPGSRARWPGCWASCGRFRRCSWPRFKSLEIADIVLVPRAFVKVGGGLRRLRRRVHQLGGQAVWNLLEIIFEVVAPAVMPYIKKAAAAFKTILKNPIGVRRQPGARRQAGLPEVRRATFCDHLQDCADQVAHRAAGRGRRLHPEVVQPDGDRQVRALGAGADVAEHPHQAGADDPRAGAGRVWKRPPASSSRSSRTAPRRPGSKSKPS